MKRIILVAAIAWLLFITSAHIHLNVGWSRVENSMRQFLGAKRDKMIVGFLPVT